MQRVHSYMRLVKPERNWRAANKYVNAYLYTCEKGLLTSSSTWLVVYEPIKQSQVDQRSRFPSALGFPFTVQDMFTIALKVIAGRLCSPRIKLALAFRPAFSMFLALPRDLSIFFTT